MSTYVCNQCDYQALYRVPQNDRVKVYGSEGHKNFNFNFNPVHVFLHFGTFVLMVLQLILALKLSELEQLEIFSANNHLESKQE